MESKMLVQMAGLSVSLSTHFAQIWPSDCRRSKILYSTSFCVYAFRMQDQFIWVGSDHLATFFTKVFSLTGRWIQQIGKMLF